MDKVIAMYQAFEETMENPETSSFYSSEKHNSLTFPKDIFTIYIRLVLSRTFSLFLLSACSDHTIHS